MKISHKLVVGFLMAGMMSMGTNLSAVEAASGQQVDTTAMEQEVVVGGWSVTKGNTKIDRHTRKVFSKALEGLVGCTYEPVALLGKQVVAGTNYCLLCRLTPVVPNAETHWGLVYIYEDLQGHAELKDVQDVVLGKDATKLN